MIDLSAAFDMVDHPLLLKKLELFVLEDVAISWMTSYQKEVRVLRLMEACHPHLILNVESHILGPLLYILFTNDIPDLVHYHLVSASGPASPSPPSRRN